MLQHALRNNVRSRFTATKIPAMFAVLRGLNGTAMKAQVAFQSCFPPVISPYLGKTSCSSHVGDEVWNAQQSLVIEHESSPGVADHSLPVVPEHSLPSQSQAAEEPKLRQTRTSSAKCEGPNFGRGAGKVQNFSDARYNVCSLGDPDLFIGDEPFNVDCGHNSDPQWIPTNELRGLLKSASPMPFAPQSITRLLHPTTPEELVLRLHQTLTFTPIPSLLRLVRYHNAYLSLQSVTSFNFLIQLAIRHTAYGLAKRLFLAMESNRIRSDEETRMLFIRLLVRTGQWTRAWRIVRDEFSRSGNRASVNLWLELFGRYEPEEFRTARPHERKERSAAHASAIRTPKTEGELQAKHLLPLEWQSHVTASSLRSLLPAKSILSDRFIYILVRHLLRTSQTKKARALTLMWLSRLPRCLSMPQRRRCMNVLHLHLGLAGTGSRVHFEGRKLVDQFLKLRPCLRPTSSTLYLLLRSLRRVRKNPTFYALQLVNAYRKRWSGTIIDRRVRRSIVHIAVKEGRMKVARKWLSKEIRAEAGRQTLLTVRQAFGEEQVRPPTKPRRAPQRKLIPGISLENRKWRWTKRRYWRRASQHHGRLKM